VLPPAKGIRLVGVTVSNFGETPLAEDAALPMFAVEQAA
jgi:DNA polymerase-4